MARGWESKSVEAQMEEAKTREAEAPHLTPEEAARRREHDVLELSRKRVLHDLETAKNPRYRKQLKAALAYLDEKLKAAIRER